MKIHTLLKILLKICSNFCRSLITKFCPFCRKRKKNAIDYLKYHDKGGGSETTWRMTGDCFDSRFKRVDATIAVILIVAKNFCAAEFQVLGIILIGIHPKVVILLRIGVWLFYCKDSDKGYKPVNYGLVQNIKD